MSFVESMKDTGVGKVVSKGFEGLKNKIDKHPLIASVAITAIAGLMIFASMQGGGIGIPGMGGTSLITTLGFSALGGVGLYGILHSLDKRFGKFKAFQSIRKVAFVVFSIISPALCFAAFMPILFVMGPHTFHLATSSGNFYMALPLAAGFTVAAGAKSIGVIRELLYSSHSKQAQAIRDQRVKEQHQLKAEFKGLGEYRD